MSFTRVKPASWIDGEVLTATQMNALDTNQSRAVDGNAGGTYTPSAAIIVNGSGLDGVSFIGAQYTPTAASLAIDGKFTLAASMVKGGFALASNEIEVPAAGLYAVSISTHVSVNNATNPTRARINLVTGASPTERLWWFGTRFSTDTAGIFQVNGTGLVNITTPSTEKLWLENASPAAITTWANSPNDHMLHIFTIVRIGSVV
jgi:hypothetical protein